MAWGEDATEYGGRYNGFDPSSPYYSGPHYGHVDLGNQTDINQDDAETARLNRYNQLDSNELGELGLGGISPGSTLNRGFLESLFSPGSMAYRMGLRAPGTSFNETAAERADRMSLIGDAVDATFGGIVRTALPAPVSLAMGLYNGYQDYQDTGNVKSALAKALSGQRGMLGAAGALASGDYGRAITSGLAGKVDPMSAGLAGIGVNAAQGQNVQRSLGGLFGGYAGSRLGGPVGGVIGSRAGRSLSELF